MSYKGRKNYLTGNILSDEWYTPRFIVDKCLSLTDLTHKKIILPYDTDNSLFTKELIGHSPIYNITDFLEGNYDYDILITNPPFSLKHKVFEKCLKDDKEFILVLPETYLFSVGFYNLIDKYKFNYKLFSPKQRVYFIDKEGKQNRPNFHTVIIHVSKEFKENTIEHFYSKTK